MVIGQSTNTNSMVIVSKKNIEICNSPSKSFRAINIFNGFCVFGGTGPGFHFLSENLSFVTSSRFVASGIYMIFVVLDFSNIQNSIPE